MSSIYNNLQFRHLVFTGILLIFIIFGLLMDSCAAMGKHDFIRNISFSPDGKKILFDRMRNNRHFIIHVYDLETGELSAYQPPIGEKWNAARYSFGGKRLVFKTTPIVGQHWDYTNSQIAIMNPDGKNIKKITNTRGFKVAPSFSHSGKKIIYGQAGMIRESGRAPATEYDVYEVDIGSGRETRLTRFKFYMMSDPYYFPDDKTFIFSAESPFAYPGIPDNDRDALRRIREEFKSRYQDNTIFVMREGEKTLKPFIELNEYSSSPVLSADGSVLIFQAQAYKPDGSGDFGQFFVYSPDGKHRRITHLRATSIWSQAISPDGKFLAVVYDVAPAREINRIIIYRVADGTGKEISLPDQPSRIINQ